MRLNVHGSGGNKRSLDEVLRGCTGYVPLLTRAEWLCSKKSLSEVGTPPSTRCRRAGCPLQNGSGIFKGVVFVCVL